MTKQNFIISRLLRSGLMIERMSQGGTLSPAQNNASTTSPLSMTIPRLSALVRMNCRSISKTKEQKNSKDLLEMETTDFDLSVRAINALRSIGVFTIGDLCSKTRLDIMRSRNLGVKSLKEIDAFMDQHGLTFKPLED